MGSAVGRAVSALDDFRGIRRGSTLRKGSVTPIDGNKFVQQECKKLEKRLPGKMVEMKLGDTLLVCSGYVMIYEELYNSYSYSYYDIMFWTWRMQ